MRGEVSFSRQEPVAGADIVLMREGDPSRLCIGVSDTNGYFRFESIEEGTWTVGIVREGAVPLIKPGIPVHPPARGVVDAILQKSDARFDPPLFDLSRYETGAAPPSSAGAAARADNAVPGSTAPSEAPEGTALAAGMTVQVFDGTMLPIREARVSLRSRGPKVNPMRGSTDGQGIVRLPDPEPGEYVLRVEVPGYLPARVDRLKLGRTAPVVTAVLTARPLDYPAKPSELLPEEKPVPPVGFPGSPDNPPPAPQPQPAAPPALPAPSPAPPTR